MTLWLSAARAEPSQDRESLLEEVERLKGRIQELEYLKERLRALEEKLEEMAAQAAEEVEPERFPEPQEKTFHLGGALRFNYVYRDFSSESKDKGGDLEFDTFRLDANGIYRNWEVSAQYRWYSFMDVIHHGWVGYSFGEGTQVQLGVTQVPFGILPYASHNWWFGLPYYVGLEDDYDMGTKLVWEREPWELQLAFFKNGEWGDSSKLERYSFDVVQALGQDNEETNQLNLWWAYTLEHGIGSTELGLSVQWGQLYNDVTGGRGTRWAGAVHLNGIYGPWNLMLEAARYRYRPENPPGQDGRTIVMGAFDTAFPVASEGTLLVANLSYDLPVGLGPLDKITFYNDYSILLKDESNFDDSQINTLGCLFSAPPVYTYVDLIFGRNAPFLGIPKDITGVPLGLGRGEPDADWETRFNLNVGYYF